MKMALSEFVLRKKGIYGILHVIILLLSLFLVISISIDTFKGIPFYEQSVYMEVQLWICALFLADFVLEWFLATDKKRYVATHFIFLLVAIPYQNIIAYMGWTFSPEVTYMLRFIPLVRGGYAMAIVVGWLTYNRASGLFVSYLTMLLATVYFSSLAFYVMEHGSNPLVKGYGDALWWAFMDVTTVGSNSGHRHRAGTVRAAGSAGHDDVPHFHSIRNEPGRAAQQGKARLLQKDRTGTGKEHSLIVKAGIFLYPPGTTVPKGCYKR